ncbi:MAG: NAD(P)H-hydrate dehydratase [Egibacteraceae bacterium]
MVPLFTPTQVRAMDQRAFGRGVASAALMERASGHLARAVLRLGGRGYGLRVGILAGKGNNGGDGIAAGRRLLDAGAAPLVHLVEGERALGEDGVRELCAYAGAGGRLANTVEAALDWADVAVDCLLGTGARGEPRSPYREAIMVLRAREGLPVVACDIPSGVDADTGGVASVAVRADLTVCLGAHKRGLWLSPARSFCGRLVLGELGIVDADDQPEAHVLEAADVAALVPPAPPEGEKRTQGVVVVLAGSPGMAGAAVLAARGALAAGAGLVTVATADPDLVTVAVPEALTARLDLADPGASFEALAGRLEDADALAVGPGLGHDERTCRLVRRIVREVEVPIVLDADGINVFRHDGDALADHAAPLFVLTPHGREFARLLGSGAEDVWEQRVALVPEKARAWGAVLVVKGPGTLIGAPDGRVWVNPTGSAALATGGTGDVLTGMAATLVAQRPEPQSVVAAVWLHGAAGQAAEGRLTARPVTPLDVAAALPDVLHRLGEAGRASARRGAGVGLGEAGRASARRGAGILEDRVR